MLIGKAEAGLALPGKHDMLYTGPLQTRVPSEPRWAVLSASSLALSTNRKPFAYCGFQLELSKFGEG